MSIIQTIRDKAAWIIIGAIAIALIAFILQDAGRNLFEGTNDTTLGKINGEEVDAIEFEQRYQQAENQYRTAGYPLNDMMRENIRESLWNEYVETAVFTERYEELGIAVSDKEINDILFGANPPQDLRQQFTDPNTGQYDANAAYQQIQQLKKQKNTPMYSSFFNQYLPALAKNRQKEKYISLISNSAYVPKWMVEKANVENSQKASISFVSIPYSTISDSTITVTDKEVEDYVNQHKDEYKQERARSIEYVMFDAAPSKSDSAAVYDQMIALKTEFASTTDPESFLVRNSSESPYFNGFVQSSKMQVPDVDSIRSLNEGAIYGPYIDGGNYILAKMIGKRSIPDSTKVRHILVKTADQGRPVLADSTAKRRIDSISNAIRGGASFDSMVVKFSDDQGSQQTGGEYDFSSMQFGNISPEFAEVAFYGNAGDKKTVKVDNSQYSGYHYIEVLNQKNFEQGYKVAYLSKPILPSDETESGAMGLASQFAGEARNRKQFDEIVKKRNLNKFSDAANIKPLESAIAGLGSSRELVKWMYEAEEGDVSERPFKIGDKYVVPVLTAVKEEGVIPAAEARPLVENIIRNRKKAEQIKKKINNVKTLEAVSQASAQPVSKADSILYSSPFIPNVGQEIKVVGAAFNKNNLNKVSEPIAGNGGVFVIRVDNVSAVANPDFDVIRQQAEMMQFQQRSLSDSRMILDILKKDVTIKDNRYKYF